MAEIEKGPTIGIPGSSRAVRPTKTIEEALTEEEKAKYLGILGPAAAPPGPAAAPQAIVVESDPILRAMMVDSLKKWEMEVAAAGSGTDALKTLATKRIDLALVDLRLPGHDGYEVIRGARSYLKLRETVIIAVGGPADPRDESAALNVGADMFYQKPMTRELFEARLKPFVRRLYDKLGS